MYYNIKYFAKIHQKKYCSILKMYKIAFEAFL